MTKLILHSLIPLIGIGTIPLVAVKLMSYTKAFAFSLLIAIYQITILSLIITII